MAESRVYEQLVSGCSKLAVVGLGYMGLPPGSGIQPACFRAGI